MVPVLCIQHWAAGPSARTLLPIRLGGERGNDGCIHVAVCLALHLVPVLSLHRRVASLGEERQVLLEVFDHVLDLHVQPGIGACWLNAKLTTKAVRLKLWGRWKKTEQLPLSQLTRQPADTTIG